MENETFAVALSDMQMPGINGVDFLEYVKSVSPNTVRIMLTGYADLNSTMAAINKANVHRFLTKPFDIDNLAAILEDALKEYGQSMDKETKSEEYLHQALHDALTGLPNRAMLIDRISIGAQRSARTGTGCALLFIDLNKFKPINDTFGHKAGDEVLCEIAGRFKSGIRNVDTAARIGGDEFVILLQDVPDINTAENLAEKLLKIIEKPISTSCGAECCVGASIGVTLFKGTDRSPQEIIESADHLMYEAKKTDGKRNIITAK
jgi:diguanylate cyclase (GGDEF)-like protein